MEIDYHDRGVIVVVVLGTLMCDLVGCGLSGYELSSRMDLCVVYFGSICRGG